MSETAIETSPLQAVREAQLARGTSDALATLRESSWRQFVEQGFPTLKQEEWRFTNLAPVTKLAYERPPESLPAGIETTLEPFRLDGTVELVFVDGRFVPALSSAALPAGISVRNLAGLDSAAWGRLASRFCSLARGERHPFVALATALFEDGALVEVARGAVVEEPLHLLYFTTSRPEPTANFPRTLIHCAENSQAKVVESFAGVPDAVYLTCPVTEIFAEPGAVLEHSKFQRESREAFHLSALVLETERGANVSTNSFSLGGAIVRHDIETRLVGEGSEATMNGLYLVDGRQLCDTHMRVDHIAPHCQSHELYKGILDGKSRAVFSGRIHVHPGAQKTDAKQTNRNLLLSDDALVNTHPQLEIFADDVKCTHGSTVGQLDEDAVFYLRSRGIGMEAAKSLLTYAFASDLVERAKVPALARELQEFLFHWIPQGDVVRDAV
ncbi:MAG: Fe-S cluster assembly protein SufD [Thermoanaerobaculia bacterium]